MRPMQRPGLCTNSGRPMSGSSRRRCSPVAGLFLVAAGVTLLSGCGPSVHDLASRGDSAALADRLAQAPETVDARNRHDKTPLHFAASYGQLEAMAVLHAQGADLDAQDVTGMTPLHTAAMFNRIDAVQWLVDAGADPTVRDRFGDTPLHTAAIFGSGHVLQFLLGQGLAADDTNEAGLTALDLAKKYHQERVVAFLERRTGG